MKILCGQNLISDSYRLKTFLLWPAFEFEFPIKGMYSNKNILEHVILQLININIVEETKIAKDTGLEIDLISFIKSRLFQKDYIDSGDKITKEGKEYIDNFIKGEKDCIEAVNIYVDAISGEIIPYIKFIEDTTALTNIEHIYPEKDENNKFTGFYKFNLNQSVGKDSDEEYKVWKLEGHQNYNYIPEIQDINETILKIYKYSNAYVPGSKVEESKDNEVYFLVEIFLPEGVSGPGEWVVSDGFGKISNFFSNKLKFISQKDNNYITNLRKELNSDFIGRKNADLSINNKYNKLSEKIKLLQKNLNIINETNNSPDAEKIKILAKNDSILYITQMFEWTFFYTLHNYKFDVAKVFSEDLANISKSSLSSGNEIGYKVYELLQKFNLKMNKDIEKRLKESYEKLAASYYENTPSLFASFDLIVLALREKQFFKDFIKNNKNFIAELNNLINLRNESFHEIKDIVTQAQIKHFYDLFKDVVKSFLSLEFKLEKGKNSFIETIDEKNKTDAAIRRTEKNLGLLLCNILDNQLITSFVNIERRIDGEEGEEEINSNIIVLDLYKMYERIFKLMNLSFTEEYKNKNWQQKAYSVGFSLKPEKIETITTTKKLDSALEGKKTSMQATCAAFIALSPMKLLRDIKNIWITFVEDISLIAKLRGHGEPPIEIDQKQILYIRNKTYKFVKLLTEKEFLISEYK